MGLHLYSQLYVYFLPSVSKFKRSHNRHINNNRGRQKGCGLLSLLFDKITFALKQGISSARLLYIYYIRGQCEKSVKTQDKIYTL